MWHGQENSKILQRIFEETLDIRKILESYDVDVPDAQSTVQTNAYQISLL
jgi:hypothetical protein